MTFFNQIKLYSVEDNYVNYLASIDSEVRLIKDGVRPYLFVFVSIDKKEYLIPMSSPKGNKKRSLEITDEVLDGTDILGYLEYHKMIPFDKSVTTEIDILKLTNSKYANLLLKEYIYCRDEITFDKITKKANIIYNARYNTTHYLYSRYLSKYACDFLNLEKALLNWLK